MRFARWITKATDTNSEYVLLIALPRQRWLRERASILRDTYIACLVEIEEGTRTNIQNSETVACYSKPFGYITIPHINCRIYVHKYLN